MFSCLLCCFAKEKIMILKMLLLCTVMGSVFAGGEPDFTTDDRPGKTAAIAGTAKTKPTIDPVVTAVRDIIFRYHREGRALLDEKIAFQRQYPDELPLEDSGIYDRGYNKSVRDLFFVSALSTVAQLVDRDHDVVVGDFGCGAGDTSFLFALTGASVMGIENQISPNEYLRSKELYSYYTTLAKRIGSEYIRSGKKEHQNVCKRMKDYGLSLRMKFRKGNWNIHAKIIKIRELHPIC